MTTPPTPDAGKRGMRLVGGPWCGRIEPLEDGWGAPDVFMHRDIPGVKYVRRGLTMTYDCKETS